MDINFPKEGNKLFVNGGGYYEFSNIEGSYSKDRQFYDYIEGYKSSADLIILNALESNDIRTLDTCVFPAVFLYRQFIELMLKHIYLAHSDDEHEAKVNTIKRTSHNIKRMWDKVEVIIRKYFPNDDESMLRAAKDYVYQFADEDSNSFNFRYPIDKDLNLIHVERKDINLRNLIERMSELEHFLNGVDSGISEMREWEAEARSYYEVDHHDYY